MDFSKCLDDATFGPIVHECRGGFDFTIRFENIFFSLVPAALFITLAVGRTLSLVRQPHLVRGVDFRSLKLVSNDLNLYSS
jgi:ATP-binding cassette subfamily C (CFTR/MRP) protein 1